MYTLHATRLERTKRDVCILCAPTQGYVEFSCEQQYKGAAQAHTICRAKISPSKVIYKVQSMPYKSLPLGAFWTIFGRNFPTGVPELLYPYQPANPLVESMFKAFFCLTSYIWATERRWKLYF